MRMERENRFVQRHAILLSEPGCAVDHEHERVCDSYTNEDSFTYQNTDADQDAYTTADIDTATDLYATADIDTACDRDAQAHIHTEGYIDASSDHNTDADENAGSC